MNVSMCVRACVQKPGDAKLVVSENVSVLRGLQLLRGAWIGWSILLLLLLVLLLLMLLLPLL